MDNERENMSYTDLINATYRARESSNIFVGFKIRNLEHSGGFVIYSLEIVRYRTITEGKVIRKKERIERGFIWVPGFTSHGTVFQ